MPEVSGDDIKDRLRAVRKKVASFRFLNHREVRALIKAARRHDAVTHTMTREEKAGVRELGTTARFPPITEFFQTVLLTGMRLGEVLGLTWKEVDRVGDAIVLAPEKTKTGQGRRIDLSVTPSVSAVLRSLKLRGGTEARVFHWLRRDVTTAARRRLMAKYGAPEFTWQELRRTCGTHLTCAPSIYGAASAFLSAKRLGHGVLVAEKHYVGAVTNIPPDARTLEAALRIEDLLRDEVLESASA
jgi:integrase